MTGTAKPKADRICPRSTVLRVFVVVPTKRAGCTRLRKMNKVISFRGWEKNYQRWIEKVKEANGDLRGGPVSGRPPTRSIESPKLPQGQMLEHEGGNLTHKNVLDKTPRLARTKGKAKIRRRHAGTKFGAGGTIATTITWPGRGHPTFFRLAGAKTGIESWGKVEFEKATQFLLSLLFFSFWCCQCRLTQINEMPRDQMMMY